MQPSLPGSSHPAGETAPASLFLASDAGVLLCDLSCCTFTVLIPPVGTQFLSYHLPGLCKDPLSQKRKWVGMEEEVEGSPEAMGWSGMQAALARPQLEVFGS